MGNHRQSCHNMNYNKVTRKPNRYKDKKIRGQKQKHKEKIEKSVKVKNVPRRSRMIPQDHSDSWWSRPYYICPETLIFIKKRVRIGGVGSTRRKGKSACPYKLKLSSKKDSIKLIPFTRPIKYVSGECVVCFEKAKMNEENTIKCYTVTHPLCKKCKDQLKKDVCPLCNNHSIGITVQQPYLDQPYLDRLRGIAGGGPSWALITDYIERYTRRERYDLGNISIHGVSYTPSNLIERVSIYYNDRTYEINS